MTNVDQRPNSTESAQVVGGTVVTRAKALLEVIVAALSALLWIIAPDPDLPHR
jgi:hypothetical protein